MKDQQSKNGKLLLEEKKLKTKKKAAETLLAEVLRNQAGDIESARNKKDELEKEIEDLNKTIDELRQRIKESQDEIDNNRKELKSVELMREEELIKIAQLKKTEEILTERIKSLNLEFGIKEDEISEIGDSEQSNTEQ